MLFPVLAQTRVLMYAQDWDKPQDESLFYAAETSSSDFSATVSSRGSNFLLFPQRPC